MFDTPGPLREVAVYGSDVSVDWVRLLSGLSEEVRGFSTGGSAVNARGLPEVAAEIETFYAFRFTDIARAYFGASVGESLSKAVVFDESCIAAWGPRFMEKIRRSRKSRLLLFGLRLPALLELFPTTFVLLTTSVESRQLAIDGGVDLVLDPTFESPEILRERLNARRNAIENETEFSRTRNQLKIIWGGCLALIAAPILVAFLKRILFGAAGS